MKQDMNGISRGGKSLRALIAGLFLFTAVFAVFSPSLEYGLVDLDDITYISNNTAVLEGLTASSIRQAFSPNNMSATMYMPLLWISYMADVEWMDASPAQPRGFHFSNVLLHALNSVLLFVLLLALSGKPWRALFFTALWAFHPLRVESVAWVTERKDVLSGLFALLCIGSYLRSRAVPISGRTRLFFTGVSLFCYGLGLLVKPSLVSIPFILLLLDFWPLNLVELTGRSVREKATRLLLEKVPYFAAAGLAAIGTVWGHHAFSGEIQVSLLLRLLSVPLTYGFYLLKIFFPRNLTVLYPHFSIWLNPDRLIALSVVSAVFLAGMTICAWRLKKRFPGGLVGWLWFLIILIPVCGIIPIPSNDVADRFSYLPAAGLSIALLPLLSSQSRFLRRLKWVQPVLACLILSGLIWLSLRQLPVWESTASLYNRVLEVFPSHATALKNRASQMIRSTGDFKEADRLISKALEAEPHHWESHFTKAQCLSELEGPAEALRHLQQIIPPVSRFTYAYWQRDLARYELMLGKYDEAIRHADQARAQVPPQDLSQIPFILLAMTAAYEKGDMPTALNYAREFAPYQSKTALELADLLPHAIFQWVAGYRQDAYAYFQRLVRNYPDRSDILNNVIWGLATANWSPADPQEVLDMAERLRDMVPEPHPGILDTLAAAQASAGDFEAAVLTLKNALALFPASPGPDLVQFRERLAARLALYEQQRPYREEAFTRMYVTYFGPPVKLREQKGP